MKNGAVGREVEEQQTPDPGSRCLVFLNWGVSSRKLRPNCQLQSRETHNGGCLKSPGDMTLAHLEVIAR